MPSVQDRSRAGAAMLQTRAKKSARLMDRAAGPRLAVMTKAPLPLTRRALLGGLALACAAPAWAATPRLLLAMIGARGCPSCAAWETQVGPRYATSRAGRAAPLLRIDIDGPWPDGLAIGARPRVTPTFLLLDRGVEVGRITGYADPATFAASAAALIERARA